MILTPLKFKKSISAACAVFLCLIKNFLPNFPDRRNSLQDSDIFNSVVKKFTGFSAAVSALSCAARHYGEIFFTRTPFRPAHHNLLQSRPPRLPCPRISSFCRFSLSRFSFPYLYILYILCSRRNFTPIETGFFNCRRSRKIFRFTLPYPFFSFAVPIFSLQDFKHLSVIFPKKVLLFFPANDIRQLLYLVHSCSN